MAKTIEQIKKEIVEQRVRIGKEQNLSKAISERQKLSAELFKLKNRKLIGAGAKAKRLSGKFGKALLKVGRKVAPVVKRQAQLIRDQQLRDDALARARLKKTKIRTPKKRKKSKSLRRKTSQTSVVEAGVFGVLDF